MTYVAFFSFSNTGNLFARAHNAYTRVYTISIMDEELLKKIEEQDKKLSLIYDSVEKTRKYFRWNLVITIVLIVLPLIGLAVLVPVYFKSLSSISSLNSSSW